MPSDELHQLRRYADALDRAAEERLALVPPEPAQQGPRWYRLGRWQPRVAVVTAVALVALLAGAGLALVRDDEPSEREVRTADDPDPQQEQRTFAGRQRCVIDVLPGPDQLLAGPLPTKTFDPSQAPAAHAITGDGQQVEVHAPGFTVIDLTGEEVEPANLDVGPAHLWRGDGFTQLRRFDGRLPACSSFTVTVHGGSRAEQADLAIAIGNRLRPRPVDPAVDGELFAPIEGRDGCSVEVLPGADLFLPGSGPPHLRTLGPDQPASAHFVTDLGGLVEVHVPGYEVADLVGEDTEPISIDLGDATLWRAPDPNGFTQLRYSNGADACGGFAVTVHQGTPDRREAVARMVANRLRPPGSAPTVGDPPSISLENDGPTTTTSAPTTTTTTGSPSSPSRELRLTIDDTGRYEVALGATITVSLHRDRGIGAPTATPDGILERTSSTETVGGSDATASFRAIAPGEVTLVAGPACGPPPRVDENGDPIYCLAVAYWMATIVVVP